MARATILGQSGTGKSWFSGKKIADIIEDENGNRTFEHAVHVDLEDEEKGLSQKDDPLLMTFECDEEDLRQVVVVDPDDPPPFMPEPELKNGPSVPLPKWIIYKNKYVRAVPDGLTDSERVVFVEMLADAAMKAEDTHFSMDEAHLVADTHNIGPKLSRLVTGGRKRGVEWVFISQRPQKLHEDILAQSNFTFYFGLSSDRDLKKAAAASDAFDPEFVAPKLGKRRAVVENFDTGAVKLINTDEMERKYPHVSGDDGKADDEWAEGTDEMDVSSNYTDKELEAVLKASMGDDDELDGLDIEAKEDDEDGEE